LCFGPEDKQRHFDYKRHALRAAVDSAAAGGSEAADDELFQEILTQQVPHRAVISLFLLFFFVCPCCTHVRFVVFIYQLFLKRGNCHVLPSPTLGGGCQVD
jgi:hypothetical protein